MKAAAKARTVGQLIQLHAVVAFCHVGQVCLWKLTSQNGDKVLVAAQW